MEGVRRNRVRLLPHNPDWTREFAATKALLGAVLGGNALDIQHVGSTAVPAIRAKPILDVAVRVHAFARLNAGGMAALGYEDCGEAGVPGRRLFVLRGPGELSLQHIHCYEPGDAGFGRQVRFRDALNARPEWARQYGALKETLARQFADDRTRYTQGKETFIRFVLDQLED